MRKDDKDKRDASAEADDLVRLTEELERRNAVLEARLQEQDRNRVALLHLLEELKREHGLVAQARREWITALDAVPDPIFIHDENMRVIRANRAYAARAGMDVRAVVGKPYWQMFPRRDGPLPACARALEERQRTEEELRLSTGEEFVSRAFPIHDADGRYLYSLHYMQDVTEWRRAEAEQRVLSEAMRQAAEAVLVLDAEARIAYLNPAFYRLFGYTPAEILGRPIATLAVPGDDEAPAPTAVVAALRERGEWKGEVRRRARDGTAIPVLLSAAAIRDAKGAITGYVGAYLDLRDIRRAEAALRESEQRFRSLIEHSSDIVAVLDREAGVRYLSPSALRLLGYAPEDLVGTNSLALVHPDDLPRARQTLAQVLANPGTLHTIEFRLRHKDGEYRHMELAGRNLLDDPAVGGIVTNVRDITERKRAEDALRESEERFRSINAAAQDAVVMLDNDGRIVYWNPAAARIFGYGADEALGHEAHVLFVPVRYHDDFHRGWARFRQTGEGAIVGKVLEVSALRKDGTEFPVELSVSALRLKGRWHAVGILRDVTERKRAAEEIRKERDTAQRYLDIAGVMLVVLDSNGKVTLVNRKGCELLGYREEEIVGQSWFERFLPERLREETRRVFGQILAGETQLTEFHENPVLTRGGAERVIAWHNRALTDEAGKIVGTLSSGEDITERKRAESKLRESERRFRSLFESAVDMIFLVDPQGLILQTNPSGPQLSGYAEAELVGHSLREFFTPASQRTFDEQFPVLLARGANRQEIEFVCKNGAVRTMDCQASAVRDENGANRFFVVYERDITKRKQTEEALRHANRALKTLSVCNAALVHAQDEPALLRDICRAITETGGYAYAWIGYVEQDDAKRIKPVAQAGFENGFLEGLSPTWADNRDGRGPSGTAVREGAVVVTRDILNDPAVADASWRDAIATLGVGSIGAFPLMDGAETFGVLTIYSRERDAFDRDELMLLAEMADDLNFGILTLRARVEHERLQEEHLKTAQQLKETLADTIRAIALTVEKRDPYTAGHQQKVAALCVAIGRELGLPEDRLEGLRLGALIHDIGKVYIPAEILNRPGKLTDAEFEIIKSHPEVGYDIVKDVKFHWPVGDMILQHHEHLDGSGYPRGLKGEAIILEARILAVADTVEAMSAHRPYRPALGIEPALAEIEQRRGDWYDPGVVDACLRLFRERGWRFDQTGESP